MDKDTSAVCVPLDSAASAGQLVVMAGAGVSMVAPSSLPGWNEVAESVLDCLVNRLESFLNRPSWLTQVISAAKVRRETNKFPPDYQAQILEEMAGLRYFEALQALDVDVVNPV